MNLGPLRVDLTGYLKKRGLSKKWSRAEELFKKDIRHPSLKVELLEPHWRGIYSLRLDKKYRALFFIAPDGSAEVFSITNHYKK